MAANYQRKSILCNAVLTNLIANYHDQIGCIAHRYGCFVHVSLPACLV